MEHAKKKLGWKINAEIDRVEKKMSRKGTTTVVKQHLKRVKATSAFVEDVHVKLQSFERSSQKTAHYGRVLGETLLNQGITYSQQHETQLGNILSYAGELLCKLDEFMIQMNEKISSMLRTKPLFLNHDYELAKEMKDSYNKTRANYDASVEKVKRINAKKGQVNLAKLAEAEAERDKLKDQLMQEQIKTGIQLQETLAKSAVDISSFLSSLFKAQYAYLQQAYELVDLRLPAITELKKKIKNAGDALPSLEKKNPTAVKVLDPTEEEGEPRRRAGSEIRRSHSPTLVQRTNYIPPPPPPSDSSDADPRASSPNNVVTLSVPSTLQAPTPTTPTPSMPPLLMTPPLPSSTTTPTPPTSPRFRNSPLKTSVVGKIHTSADETATVAAISRAEQYRQAFVSERSLSMKSDSALQKYLPEGKILRNSSKTVKRKSLEAAENEDSVTPPSSTGGYSSSEACCPIPTSSEETLSQDAPKPEMRRRGMTSPAAVSPELRRRRLSGEEAIPTNNKLSRDKLAPATSASLPSLPERTSGKKHGFKVPTVKKFKKKKLDNHNNNNNANTFDPLRRSATYSPSSTPPPSGKSKLSRSVTAAKRKTGDFTAYAHNFLQMPIDNPNDFTITTTAAPILSQTLNETAHPVSGLKAMTSSGDLLHDADVSSENVPDRRHSASPPNAYGSTIRKMGSDPLAQVPLLPEVEQLPQQPQQQEEEDPHSQPSEEWHVKYSGPILLEEVFANPSLCPSTISSPMAINRNEEKDREKTKRDSSEIASSGYTPSPPLGSSPLIGSLYTGDHPFSEEEYTDLLTELNVKTAYLFEAIRMRKRKNGVKTAIAVDMLARTITLCTSKREQVLSFNSLLQVQKARSDSTKLFVFWKMKERREKYLFKSAADRDLIFAVIWFTKNPVMDVQRHRFKRTECIELFIGNWNLGDATPPSSLVSWIPRDRYDIYAIAVQECRYPPRFGNSSCEGDWFGCIQSHLGPAYIKMAGLSLLSIRLLIMVRREHYYKISNIEKGTEATGIANVVGNKGGIGVSFSFNETRLCFIGAHLAAHQDMVDARNKDFHSLLRGLAPRLGSHAGDLHNQFHHLFFFGDLNYRIDLERPEVIGLVKEKNWITLHQHDQLRAQQAEGKVFRGFQEGVLAFPPTYRYNRGDREYSEEKMRIPSYTDRILWRSLPDVSLDIHSYQSHDDITTSDHSPISASFVLETLLPPLPFEEREERCVIMITNLHGVDLGRHKKWKKMTKKELKEEKKREKQEKRKEMKEIKRGLKESRRKAKKKKEKKKESGDTTNDEEEVDTDESSTLGTTDEYSTSEEAFYESDSSVKLRRSTRKRLSGGGGSTNRAESPEEKRREKDSDVIRPHTETVSRRNRSHTDGPLPDFREGGRLSGVSASSSPSLKRSDGGVLKNSSASRSFSDLSSIIDLAVEGKELQREKLKKVDKTETKKRETEPKEGTEEKRHERIPNPFIVFTAAFLDGSIKTNVQMKTSEPKWLDEDIPVMEPTIHSRHYLKRQHIFIAVRDHHGMSSLEDIGQGVLSLKEVCKKKGRGSVDFSVELLDRGTPAGTVHGTMAIRWGDENELKTPEKKRTRKEKRLSKRFTGMEPLLLKQSGKGY